LSFFSSFLFRDFIDLCLGLNQTTNEPQRSGQLTASGLVIAQRITFAVLGAHAN
jgi:hypothetical protein